MNQTCHVINQKWSRDNRLPFLIIHGSKSILNLPKLFFSENEQFYRLSLRYRHDADAISYSIISFISPMTLIKR